ncbi:MAG: hypothetical protein ACREIV_16160, partial [Planctomycetaceae bacterium]
VRTWLVLRAADYKTLADVPASKQGEIYLLIRRRDRDDAAAFVATVNGRLDALAEEPAAGASTPADAPSEAATNAPSEQEHTDHGVATREWHDLPHPSASSAWRSSSGRSHRRLMIVPALAGGLLVLIALALAGYALSETPHGSDRFWSWMGGALACLCTGAGTLLASWRTERAHPDNSSTAVVKHAHTTQADALASQDRRPLSPLPWLVAIVVAYGLFLWLPAYHTDTVAEFTDLPDNDAPIKIETGNQQPGGGAPTYWRLEEPLVRTGFDMLEHETDWPRRSPHLPAHVLLWLGCVCLAFRKWTPAGLVGLAAVGLALWAMVADTLFPPLERPEIQFGFGLWWV